MFASLPSEARPVAHEYDVWWKKTNFHLRVVFARSFASQFVCVGPTAPPGLESSTVKWASP